MCGRAITYTFKEKTRVSSFRLVVDSDLDREYVDGNPDALNTSMVLFRRRDYNNTTFGFPKCLLRAFRIEALDDDGNWRTVYETDSNRQRLVRGELNVETTAVRFIPLATYFSDMLWTTYGSAQAHIFAFEVR
ncbi:MAG: hypothetical protein ACOYIA_07495 [Eubacteriales bacterium]|jgi:hypothetical protein